MNSKQAALALTMVVGLIAATSVSADQYQLVTGVDAGTSPGAARTVTSTSFGNGSFHDGQRLGGTPSAAPITPFPGVNYIQSPNQFGSLSYMFRRGSINFGGPATPFVSIDYLGGPLLDLDGDLGNGSRSLIPVPGQTAVAMPGTTSNLDLTFGGGQVTLNSFDVNGNNAGLGQGSPEQLVTVNTLAGTSITGTPGAAINPSIDDRTGTSTAFLGNSGTLSGVSRVENLGYEMWQDTLGASSSVNELGTVQFLGELKGWKIERDINGNFPTLAGEGLGSTTWPSVNTSEVGNSFNDAIGPGMTTIGNGIPGADVFDAPGNGGLALTDFGGDLGAYLDHIAATAINPLSQSFIYFESAGFGINNSPDPVFFDSSGWDIVLIAQSTPVPEPATVVLLLAGCFGAMTRRRS